MMTLELFYKMLRSMLCIHKNKNGKNFKEKTTLIPHGPYSLHTQIIRYHNATLTKASHPYE